MGQAFTFCTHFPTPLHGTFQFSTEATPVFSKMRQLPPTVAEDEMRILERLVVLMYDRSSTVRMDDTSL